MKRVVFISLLILFQIKSWSQTIELADLLSSLKTEVSASNFLTIQSNDILIGVEDSVALFFSEDCFTIGFSISNYLEIHSPYLIVDYLEENDFIILYSDESRNEFGDLVLFFRYEEKYWFAQFSCGSHGCGIDFTQIY